MYTDFSPPGAIEITSRFHIRSYSPSKAMSLLVITGASRGIPYVPISNRVRVVSDEVHYSFSKLPKLFSTHIPENFGSGAHCHTG